MTCFQGVFSETRNGLWFVHTNEILGKPVGNVVFRDIVSRFWHISLEFPVCFPFVDTPQPVSNLWKHRGNVAFAGLKSTLETTKNSGDSTLVFPAFPYSRTTCRACRDSC